MKIASVWMLIAFSCAGIAQAADKICDAAWVEKNERCKAQCASQPPRTREWSNCIRACREDHLQKEPCTPPSPPPKEPPAAK